ncbi:MAG: phosphoenolpyruvate--protein phosphotransferase [Polyangiaceae bacterium]|nr:phosphoenolpyruvate--protein phosphotransferase [Polyangiaceae bacterium]
MSSEGPNGDDASEGSGVELRSSTSLPLPALVLTGIAGSPGYAIGPTWVVDVAHAGVVHRSISRDGIAVEVQRFERAVQQTVVELREVVNTSSVGGAETSILEAYILMVCDPTLMASVQQRIKSDRRCAEWAVDTVIREMSLTLKQSENRYLAERSHDIEFVGERLLRVLTGKASGITLPEGPTPFILVARDLSPAETLGLTKDRVLALVTEAGTRTSHTAILARALDIPAVMGVGDILSQIQPGETALVDGSHGVVALRPSPTAIATARLREERYRSVASGLRRRRRQPTTTQCGVAVQLKANIEFSGEALTALENGAQGIGLYRTEFLYLDRTDLPSEEEQYQTYARVLESTAPLSVTLRTFDIGADKFPRSLAAPLEPNPALGLRAVRLALERPELFLTQLRALVRATAHGRGRILLPMISAVHEFRGARALLQEAINDVDKQGLPRAPEIPLGMMVEVPSAAILADTFAREAEFLSIGTNDLVQYTLAVDRSNRQLVRLASFFDPSVLQLVANVVRAGERHGRSVAVCGSMASDPLAAILLVGMGLRELSMEASAIGTVKEALGRVTVSEAEAAWVACAVLSEAEAVDTELAQRFAPRMSDLLDREVE